MIYIMTLLVDANKRVMSHYDRPPRVLRLRRDVSGNGTSLIGSSNEPETIDSKINSFCFRFIIRCKCKKTAQS